MTPVDYFIAFLFVVSAGIGLWRGFAKEALSLLTLLAAIWLAWRFAVLLEPHLGDWAGAPELRIWVARVVMFVVVLILGAMTSWLAQTLIKHTGLSGLDRLFGAAFGLLRAVVLLGLAVIALQIAGLDQDPWWQQARLKPYADRIAAAVRYYAELGGRFLSDHPTVEV